MNNKRKFGLAALTIVLLVSASFAYFTDKTQNTATGNSAVLCLTEVKNEHSLINMAPGERIKVGDTIKWHNRDAVYEWAQAKPSMVFEGMSKEDFIKHNFANKLSGQSSDYHIYGQNGWTTVTRKDGKAFSMTGFAAYIDQLSYASFTRIDSMNFVAIFGNNGTCDLSVPSPWGNDTINSCSNGRISISFR